MSNTDANQPAAAGSPVEQELGLAPEREAFEAWKLKQGGHYMSRNNAPGSDLNGYQDAYTQGQWEAWQAAVAAERERWAKLCTERAQLSWAAADQPHAPEVKMQHEAVAMAMEELARELRA